MALSGGLWKVLSVVKGAFEESVWWSKVLEGGEPGSSKREVLQENVSGIVPSMIHLSGLAEVREVERRWYPVVNVFDGVFVRRRE